jgi:tyrosine decarboxylase/aspartate 1-decarboxylase
LKKSVIKNNILKKLNFTKAEIKASNYYRLGYPQTNANKFGGKVLSSLLELNPNNVGVMSQKKMNLKGTKLIEADFVKQLSNFFNGKNVEGYITSGATESNLEALWIAREEMKIKSRKFCLLKTKLTHFSIEKAINILQIENVFDIDFDENYSLSLESLNSKVTELCSKGFDGFIVVATVGYTLTGSSDNVKEISDLLGSLKKVNTFLHVDAAFGGLVLPFSRKNFVFDFRLPKVNSIAVDMHKMGLAPYSAGVFLCRKGLLNYVSREVDYTGSVDATVLGSRSGASITAAWAVFNYIGQKGYAGVVKRCLSNKKYFLSKVKDIETKEIFNPLGMNVVSLKTKKRFPRFIEEKYRLDAVRFSNFNNVKEFDECYLYRFYFMPHQDLKVIKDFFKDLKYV